MRLFLALVVVTLVTVASAQVQGRRFVRPSQVKLAVQPALYVQNPSVVNAVADEGLESAAVAVPKLYPRYYNDYNYDYDWGMPPRFWGGSPNWYGWGRGGIPYGMPQVVREPVQQDTTTVSEVAEPVAQPASSDSTDAQVVADS
ncbi:uncharacterized protein [Drosophila tropicalis]|uniref:uncharacterized protein n=1 Tax=Drosophila tropicalis TaxID=46794 RepID=UPI0035AC01DA